MYLGEQIEEQILLYNANILSGWVVLLNYSVKRRATILKLSNFRFYQGSCLQFRF